MKKSITQICAVILVSFGTQLNAADVAANSPYYERDGWLDITEWFDGNDYNPTDEAWWRWDDETYQATKDKGTDIDNDSWYGYTTRDDNDWYYDYYDPYHYGFYDFDANDVYEYGSRYYDYNDDGIYDAYAWYSDVDGDGFFEDYDYYSFADTKTRRNNQQSQKQAAAAESRQQTITGRVQKTKLVRVPGGNEHVIVALQPQQGQAKQQDQLVIADLGRAEDLKNINPKLGNQITVKGPQAQVGEQKVLLARSVDLNGQKKQITRNQRTITGKVLATHRTKVRGQEHVLAMVESDQKGKARKIAVDLGPANRLQMNLTKGSTVTFSGFPVKVKDKLFIMAQSVEKNNQFVEIQRQPNALEAAGKGK